METSAALLSEIKRLVTELTATASGGGASNATALRGTLTSVIQELSNLSQHLDPSLRPSHIFDPADPGIAGRIAAMALVAQDRHPLGSVPLFYGSGIYAIYYHGTYPAYAPLCQTEHPIYVGKADPGSPTARTAEEQGNKLSARLREHAKNIGKASTTLHLDDFECRFLVVQTGFQKAAEDNLIALFKPIWNSETKIAFGLGKHGDSAETRGNKRSPWDTLHPGRKWAENTAEDQKPASVVIEEIAQHLSAQRIFTDVPSVLNAFLQMMRQALS